MATTVTTRPPSNPPKSRPPPPSPLQTSISISTNGAAQSAGAKRLPATIISTPITSANGLASGNAPKSAPKRKDSQKPLPNGTTSKNGTSEGKEAARRQVKGKLKESYVRTSEDVLRKFAGKPPSLVLHLYTNHFRFDQQDGSFGYHSPMRIILEHVKAETVPHDMLEELRQGNVPFYDGCLIVEIHDHKSVPAATKDANIDPAEASNRIPFSIHNYNEHITPSPHVPYPPRKTETQPRPEMTRTSSIDGLKPIKQEPGVTQLDSSVPPSQSNITASRQPKIFTRVLHPTQLSRHRELTYLATTPMPEPRNRRARESGTPLTAAPPTPLSAISTNTSKSGSNKRQKMMLEEKDIYDFESLALRSTEVPLFLEPAEDLEDALAIMKSLTHPLHDQATSKAQGRKRTTAELAADEAQAAEEERTLLIMDERIKPTLTAAGTTGEGLSAADEFQPNFARFKAFEDIRTRHLQEQAERAQREARAREEAKLLQEQQQQQGMERLKQEQQQENPQAQLQRQTVPQANAPNTQMRPSNAMMQQHNAQQQQQLMQNQNLQALILQQQQQATQGQVNSPMMQSGTPVNVISPSNNQMGAVPMGLTMSSQGGIGPGSSPRPGSALQMQAAANQIAMARQASQAPSHPSISRHGTPQVPQMTPMMPNGVPTGHMTPQPQQRLGQGSPPPMGMQGTPMMNMTPQMSQQQQQAIMMQQRRMVAAQAQAAQANVHAQAQMQGSPLVQSQISPQHQAMLQAQLAQQMSSSPHVPNAQNHMQGTQTPNMLQQGGAARAEVEYRRQVQAQASGRIMQLQRQNGTQQGPNGMQQGQIGMQQVNNMQQGQQANFNPGTPGIGFTNGVAMTPSMSAMSHNTAQAQFLAAQQQAAQQQQKQQQQAMNMQMQQQVGQGFLQQQQQQQQLPQQGQVNLITAQQQLMQRQKDKDLYDNFIRHLAKHNGGQIPPDAAQQFAGWKMQQQARQRQAALQQFQATLHQQQQQHQQQGGPAISPGQVLQNGVGPPNGMPNMGGNFTDPNVAQMHQLAQLQYRQKLQQQSQMMGNQQRHAQAQAQALAQARNIMANGQMQGTDVNGMMNGMGRGGG